MKHAVKWDELLQAYVNFVEIVEIVKGKKEHKRLTKFFDFLGLRGGAWKEYGDAVLLTDNGINRLNWLKGPHAATMYKAWKAKNGRQKTRTLQH